MVGQGHGLFQGVKADPYGSVFFYGILTLGNREDEGMANEGNGLAWALGAAVVWINSLDYVLLGNITQVCALVYLAAGILGKVERALFGERIVSRKELKAFRAWRAEVESNNEKDD